MLDLPLVKSDRPRAQKTLILCSGKNNQILQPWSFNPKSKYLGDRLEHHVFAHTASPQDLRMPIRIIARRIPSYQS